MSFGKNLQHLRRLSRNMTQEALADKLCVSRQTISKWEMDSALPEMDKAIELCSIFSCTLDDLFRVELDAFDTAYSSFRVETVPAFRYIKHAVISTDPEGDALDRIHAIARKCGVDKPSVIGWDFPFLSNEQINVYHMHGYEAAWMLPDGVNPEGQEIHEQAAHKYAAVHIERPFDNPFVMIPGAYKALMSYMRINGLQHTEKDVIPCFETDGDTMDIYIACL
ncbi:MAG: helix-turn-helix domain-containing protein [Clostridiales bacterium]|nr:helix-turn-helix domain-containing protein [Clostridiales bacterium]